jgi:hypothetical protein
MQDMNKAERCAQLAIWLERGDRFTISEAARRMEERYINVWRDVESLGRVLPIAKDEGGQVYLIRLTVRELM